MSKNNKGRMRVRRANGMLYLDVRPTPEPPSVPGGIPSRDIQQEENQDMIDTSKPAVGVTYLPASVAPVPDREHVPVHPTENSRTGKREHAKYHQQGVTPVACEVTFNAPSPEGGRGVQSERYVVICQALEKLSIRTGQSTSPWVMFEFTDDKTTRQAQTFVSQYGKSLRSRQDGWIYKTTIPPATRNKLWVRMVRVDPVG